MVTRRTGQKRIKRESALVSAVRVSPAFSQVSMPFQSGIARDYLD